MAARHPLSRDFSGFENRLHWAETHVSDCAAMAANAHATMKVLTRQDYRDQSNRLAIDALRRRMNLSAA